jgi:hypothetical protein
VNIVGVVGAEFNFLKLQESISDVIEKVRKVLSMFYRSLSRIRHFERNFKRTLYLILN